MAGEKLDEMAFATAWDWERWLRRNHAASPGVWIRFQKKGSDKASVTYDEAVEGALCYGWIDGQLRPKDASSWLRKFTPRGPRSVWSRINREKAERLIRKGRMAPAGLEAVQRARKDGRWEAAYHPPSDAALPADLQAALNKDPEARAFFSSLDRANRYAITWRLATAKRPETRARRLQTFLQMLREHRKLHP